MAIAAIGENLVGAATSANVSMNDPPRSEAALARADLASLRKRRRTRAGVGTCRRLELQHLHVLTKHVPFAYEQEIPSQLLADRVFETHAGRLRSSGSSTLTFLDFHFPQSGRPTGRTGTSIQAKGSWFAVAAESVELKAEVFKVLEVQSLRLLLQRSIAEVGGIKRILLPHAR